MKFDDRHKLAAEALAKGESERKAAKVARVADSTITRWKRVEAFQDLISYYESPEIQEAVELAQESKIEVFQTVSLRESELISKLEIMLDKLGELLVDKFNDLSSEDLEDMPLRLVPQYLKSYTESLRLLQEINDRETGYHVISQELAKVIEAQ